MKIKVLTFVLLTWIAISAMSQEIVPIDNWKFRQVGTFTWYNATVPGTVHTDLLNNNLIPDPFYRLNESEVQWIDKVDWEYKTEFKITEKISKAEKLVLTFEGLDTYADIYLNGKMIHSNANMFTTVNVEIDNTLIKQDNEIRIYFKSPIIEGLSKLEKYGLSLPADNDQSERGGIGSNKVSVFTRKAPYHFGWDWGPRLVTSGIWRKVYFQIHNDAFISDFYIKQSKVNQKFAELSAEFEVNNKNNKAFTVNVLLNDSLIVKDFKIQDDKTLYSVPIRIENPLLWWPNGHGKQNLCSFTVQLINGKNIINSIKVNTGLRNIALIRQPDEKGESFYFEVNGKPVFAKGANFIPGDVFLPRISKEKYEALISSAAASNINMLRVWGGGIYEDEIFYELCDKYGIMVWQDFMFACAMYPGDEEFLKNISNEVIDNIKRLRKYACLAVWCGNNEIEQAWGQYEESRGWGWKQRYSQDERSIIWQSYDTLFHYLIPGLIEKYDPEANYWHSSPSGGKGILASHTNTSGDMHYWGIWHGNEPIEMFAKYKARFMSEYGFQSFPEFESIKQFTLPSDWNFESPVMTSHQRSNIGNQRIMSYLNNSYKIPVHFEEQLYVGQLLQAEAIKKAIHAHRSEMPYCMGSLYWQLNDCWPGASWSGIDYYGRWKALQYFVKEAFENQILTIKVEDNQIIIDGISDTESTEASLRVNLMNFNGVSLWNRSFSVKIPSNSSKELVSIPLEKLPVFQNKNKSLLFVSLVKNEKMIDTEIYYFEQPKKLELLFPDLNIHIRQKPDEYELEIFSKNLCKNLMLVSEGNAYAFSDNFFDILPGETKFISVKSDLPYDIFEKKLSYVHLQQIEYMK